MKGDHDCSEASRASLKCIEEHGYQRDAACTPFFEAYKECKREAAIAKRSKAY